MASIRSPRPRTPAQVKYVELDCTPFTTPTTVENAVERLSTLRERLCDKPLNPYSLAEKFGFNLGDKKLPDPMVIQPVYSCARMIIIDKGIETNPDYGWWRGLKGQ